MNALQKIVLVGLLMVGITTGAPAQDSPDGDNVVNLDHLRFLTEIVEIDNEPLALVHIYSEYPDYRWIDAAGEGLACVDDVARAAVVYMWEYERSGDPALLELARASLNFVLYLQASDGEFYNFVYDRDMSINERGGTSYKSLGWWAMRGMWALGEGVRVFDTIDPPYADRLAEAYLLTETALGSTLGNYGDYIERHGFTIPAWIPGGEPAVASIGLLGLAAYYDARPNPITAQIMTRIADGVAEYRLGDHATYPFGMHPVRTNAPGFWHDWGAHMTHGLVVAGMALDRQDWIDSAAATADSFLLRHLVLERFRHIGVVPNRLEQIAYGTNQLALTYLSLYEATGAERYARYAGLSASWYFGNNMANTQMYFPENGRVYDGINGPVAWRVNRNSGAESTIEGLMSMIAIADVPLALDYLHVQPIGGNSYRVLEAESGDRVVGTPIYYPVTWTGEGYVSSGRYIGLSEGQRMRLAFTIEQPDDYLLYVAHVHQAANSTSFTVQRTDAPPDINGRADDWPDELPRMESNSSGQFLRGAGTWEGPEVDSHAVRLMWDDDYLYLLAEVRDPVHEQPYTLSTVWQADTLWIYMTPSPDARQLSAKFTLAQTPDGPEIWDWVNTRFLRDATLAWAEQDGGYTYEASIPWSSLDIESPEPGQRIGFEAGRGIGGNSFMSLTGRDPDIASNLLELVLIDPAIPDSLPPAPEVSLSVQLNDFNPVIIPQTISPDSDYFWLDLVNESPVYLEAGEHMLRYRHVGEDDSNPGISKVDAFYLQPVVARTLIEHPDGRIITLSYDTITGDTRWEEIIPDN